MNAIQLPLAVEALLLVVAMGLGTLLGLKAKPYGKVKLSFHLFFFLWFTLGYYFVAQILFTGRAWTGTEISVLVMGVALAVQIATGLTMLASKARNPALPPLHAVSASVVLVADVAGFFLAGGSPPTAL